MRSIPKKYKKGNTAHFNFIYSFDDYKQLFKVVGEKNWNNLIREILRKALIDENKKLSDSILSKKDYTPFSDYVYEIVPQAHFDDDGSFEELKLKLLKLIQITHERIKKPIGAFLIWNDRHKAGFKTTDKLLFESVFQFLVDDGQVDEVIYSYKDIEYVKYEPVIAIRRRRVRNYTNRDLDKIEVIRHAKKDGSLYTRKRDKNGDDT